MEKKPRTLLCIDDEPNILNALKRLLRKEDFRLLTGSSGKEGLQILAENEVHVVVSDQRMPEMNGTEFLKEVRTAYPDIIRIILTGYTDVDSISEAINEGHLYKFFLKPWNDQNLKLEIRQAMEQYDLVKANRELHNQVIQQNAELKKINENLEQIILERTQNLEFQNKALQISHAILDDLPLPILGVSSEMLVVMANKAAREHMGQDRSLDVGSSIGDCFDSTVETGLNRCLDNLSRECISAQCKNGKSFELELIPFSGRFRGQGIIMTLNAVGESSSPDRTR